MKYFFPCLENEIRLAQRLSNFCTSILITVTDILIIFQVLLAIGRDACTRKIGLETVGVKINEK